MKALLSNHRQQPRKVRRVAGLIRGKAVSEALLELSARPMRAAKPLKKLLESAVANAHKKGVSTEQLYVKEIVVNKGITLKRHRPVSRGQAHPIRKRRSHISIVLETRAPKKSKARVQKKEVKA